MEKCLEIYRRSTAPKDPGEAAPESVDAGELMDKFDIGQADADNMACVVGAELPPPASAVSGARKKKKEKRGTYFSFVTLAPQKTRKIHQNINIYIT